MGDASSRDSRETTDSGVAWWNRLAIVAYVVVSNALLAAFTFLWIVETGTGSPLSWGLSEWTAAAIWYGPTLLMALFVTMFLPYAVWDSMHSNRSTADEVMRETARETTGSEGVVFDYDADAEDATEHRAEQKRGGSEGETA